LWKAEHASSGDGETVVMTYVSPDGDQGYPGTCSVTMAYTLQRDGRFRVDYGATVEGKASPVNLTHHPYFNLAGAGSGEILSHVLTIDADAYLPVDSTLIPTGEVKDVAGTPFDFRTPHKIGDRIADVPGGYDHNFCLRAGNGMRRAAHVLHEESGREMEIATDYPGVQFYSGNFLNGSLTGTTGGVYNKYGGFCLETQLWPDAVNHPSFPNTILRPGQVYKHSAVYRFSAR
jgi:aldose 1-epimerase